MPDNNFGATHYVQQMLDNLIPGYCNRMARKRLVEARDGYLSPTPVEDAVRALASDLRAQVVDVAQSAEPSMAQDLAMQRVAQVDFREIARGYVDAVDA